MKTEIELKNANTLEEIAQVLVCVCENLKNKAELHIHFIIGNNITGNSNSIGTGNKILIETDKVDKFLKEHQSNKI
jgi:hypothetical protein